MNKNVGWLNPGKSQFLLLESLWYPKHLPKHIPHDILKICVYIRITIYLYIYIYLLLLIFLLSLLLLFLTITIIITIFVNYIYVYIYTYGFSKHTGTPKSSIAAGFSIITNHLGDTPNGNLLKKKQVPTPQGRAASAGVCFSCRQALTQEGLGGGVWEVTEIGVSINGGTPIIHSRWDFPAIGVPPRLWNLHVWNDLKCEGKTHWCLVGNGGMGWCLIDVDIYYTVAHSPLLTKHQWEKPMEILAWLSLICFP